MSECEETLGGRDEGEALRDLRLGVLRQEDALRAAEPPRGRRSIFITVNWSDSPDLACAGREKREKVCARRVGKLHRARSRLYRS